MTDYEDIDQKALIMQQNALLTAILDELRDESQTESPPEQVECLVCMTTLPEDEKADHARSCFGWHDSMGQEILDSKYDTANDK
jgi:hypothetical protein